MKDRTSILVLACAGLLLANCTTDRPRGGAVLSRQTVAPEPMCRVKELSTEVKKRILSLDPERVTEAEVREVLSGAPAPQVLCIHGGLLPIKWGMNSFAEFLMGLGYPEVNIRNPGTGELTYGYYHRSEMLAGIVAWHYERTGLQPILIGHSMGGIQAIRVLHKLAGNNETTIPVWNPATRSAEPRHEIIDPLTGITRPVVGLRVGFAAVSVAGGLARAIPNEWDMNGKLRDIPDSVEEFTGFQKGLDLLGGDYFGFGPANDYHAAGAACVRNVRLPSTCSHSAIPYVRGLLEHQELKNWINQYKPPARGIDIVLPESGYDSKKGRVLWAAEVWYSIKKHWVLELQRLIRAQERQPA